MGKDSKAFLSALVTRELIPGYAGVIRDPVTKGEATPSVFVDQFDQIVKRLHRRQIWLEISYFRKRPRRKIFKKKGKKSKAC